LIFSGTNPQQGSENREPLPNPWSGANPAQGGGNAPQPGGAPLGVLNTPAMQSLLQQMGENPSLMQNLMNAPYTRSMMEAMSADPNMASSVSFINFFFVLSKFIFLNFSLYCQLINQNPLLANNPQLQEQMRQMMPNFLQQMQNPEIQNMMTSPQALNAILQIQQGMEQLRSAAPGLVDSLGIPPPPPGSATSTNSSATPTSTTPNPSQPTLPNNPALFSDFMTRMLNGLSTNGPNSHNQPPEERYSSQLEQLTAMGFVNRDANLQGNLGELR